MSEYTTCIIELYTLCILEYNNFFAVKLISYLVMPLRQGMPHGEALDMALGTSQNYVKFLLRMLKIKTSSPC